MRYEDKEDAGDIGYSKSSDKEKSRYVSCVAEAVKQKVILPLKEECDKLKIRRVPKIVLIGRTGVGKSSLINTLCGRYVAKVSPVYRGTTEVCEYSYPDEVNPLITFCDSRGVGDIKGENEEEALKQLIREMDVFKPDAILYLQRADDRAYIDRDLAALQRVRKEMKGVVPTIVALTRADSLEPGEYLSAGNKFREDCGKCGIDHNGYSGETDATGRIVPETRKTRKRQRESRKR